MDTGSVAAVPVTNLIRGHKRKGVEKILPVYVPGGGLLPFGSHTELSSEKLRILTQTKVLSSDFTHKRCV